MNVKRLASSVLLGATLWIASAAWAANQVLLRNVDIGDKGTALALTADGSGNLFVVSASADAAGLTQILVTKTDPKGAKLAAYSIPVQGFNGLGPAEAVAADAQGNLILAGTFSGTAGLPVVKPNLPHIRSAGADWDGRYTAQDRSIAENVEQGRASLAGRVEKPAAGYKPAPHKNRVRGLVEGACVGRVPGTQGRAECHSAADCQSAPHKTGSLESFERTPVTNRYPCNVYSNG